MIYDIKKPFPNKGLKELRTLTCAAFVTGIVLHSCAFKPAEAASLRTQFASWTITYNSRNTVCTTQNKKMSCTFIPTATATKSKGEYNPVGSYEPELSTGELSFDKKCSILEHFHYSGHPGCYLFLKHGHTKFCIPRNEVKLCA